MILYPLGLLRIGVSCEYGMEFRGLGHRAVVIPAVYTCAALKVSSSDAKIKTYKSLFEDAFFTYSNGAKAYTICLSSLNL
jgi:hypothetical protein